MRALLAAVLVALAGGVLIFFLSLALLNPTHARDLAALCSSLGA